MNDYSNRSSKAGLPQISYATPAKRPTTVPIAVPTPGATAVPTATPIFVTAHVVPASTPIETSALPTSNAAYSCVN